MLVESLNLQKLKSFCYENITTCLIIIFITFLNGQAYINGNIVWLPIGAVSLCYLLFGFRVFMAVFLGITLSSLWFHNNSFSGINFLHLVGTFAPLLAIVSMKVFKLSYFFDGEKLVFQHLLFLAILTAFYNTLMKFFVYSYFSDSPSSFNAIQFIQNYLIGDILGCLVVLFFAALVVVPAIKYLSPNSAPME